jgi:NAD+ synthase
MFKSDEYTEKLVNWLQEQVRTSGRKGLVFGLSGGIDSAVVAALAVKSFPRRSLGLIMPCQSDPGDREDALLVAKTIGLPVEEVELTAVYDCFLKALPVDAHGAGSLSTANIKPRLRMTALYYFAALYSYLVVGTSNASEIVTGYFTKYGDSGVDIIPLGRLTKGEVAQLAEHLGIPRKIIEKPPSGGLWAGQTDESEMGVTYGAIDAYLRGGAVAAEDRKLITGMEERSGHKRRMPPMPDF